MQRSSFRPVLNYVLGKDRALLLDADGVSTESIEAMASGFEMQASLRPSIAKPVKHIALAFHPNDKEALDNERMIAIAKEYLEAMGCANVPYVLVRHFDAQHPHIHIVLNKIGYDGRAVSDRHERVRNAHVCRQLTEQHGLYISPGKQAVRLERLRGLEKKRHELFFAIRKELVNAKTWNDLVQRLSEHKIRIEFKHKGSTEVVEGVKFIRGDLSFSGSKIDRSLSYARICNTLAQNSRSIAPTKQTLRPHSHPTEPDLIHLLRRFGAAMGPITPTNNAPDDDEEEKENLKTPTL